MSELAVLVPVLNRPHRVQPLLEAIDATTPGVRVVFLLDAGDEAEEGALNAAMPDQVIESFRSVGQFGSLTVEGLIHSGTYAEKTRAGVEATVEELILTGADDLEPCPGWFEAAKAHLRNGVQVVGVNDMIERPHRLEHSTHFLMRRAYAERPTIDGKPGPFFHGYSHSFTDDELIATARARGVYTYAQDARLRHLHPDAGTGVEWDETYRKGREHMYVDRKLFRRRSRLWRA